MTGALLNSCIWLKGCSRKSYPPHIHGNVLPPTVEPPASTPFRPSLPSRLPHCRHSATRACRPRVHGYGLFPGWREKLAITSPSFRLRSFVLEPTRHMARTRAPDRHAKILPCRAFRVTAGEQVGVLTGNSCRLVRSATISPYAFEGCQGEP